MNFGRKQLYISNLHLKTFRASEVYKTILIPAKRDMLKNTYVLINFFINSPTKVRVD